MELSSPRHSWKEHDRVIVSLLFVYYDCRSEDIKMIFNHICSGKLSAEGFQNGLRYSTIRSQLGDMQAFGAGNMLYTEIEGMSSQEVRRRFGKERDTIEQAAQELNIVLRLPIKAKRITSAAKRKRTRFMKRLETPESFIFISDTSSEEGDVDYATPTKPAKKRSATNQLQTSSLVLNHDFEGNAAQRRPLFLFRTCERDHNFTARRYLDEPENIPQPPDIKSHQFLDLANPHLHEIVPYASPFLSFAQNPKNALKRIRAGTHLQLVVFLYNDVEKDAHERFGADAGPYLTPDICKMHSLTDLPRSPNQPNIPYTARGEFLVWGAIRCEPVAALDAAEACQLRSVMESVRLQGFNFSAKLSECLTRIPIRWKSAVARKLVYAYIGPTHVGLRSCIMTRFLEVSEGTECATNSSNTNKPSERRITAADWSSDNDEELGTLSQMTKPLAAQSSRTHKIILPIVIGARREMHSRVEDILSRSPESLETEETPATSVNSSGGDRAIRTDLRISDDSLAIFRQQVNHFAAESPMTSDAPHGISTELEPQSPPSIGLGSASAANPTFARVQVESRHFPVMLSSTGEDSLRTPKTPCPRRFVCSEDEESEGGEQVPLNFEEDPVDSIRKRRIFRYAIMNLRSGSAGMS